MNGKPIIGSIFIKQRSFFFVAFISILFLNCSGSKNIFRSSFSVEQSKLIMSSDSNTPMRVYKITNQKDSLLLRMKSESVKANPNDKTLQTFVKRLYTTVRDSMSMGVGIAAPQVGVLKNIIWVQRFDKENFPFEAYLNPKIIEYSVNKQTYKVSDLFGIDKHPSL